MKSIIYEKKSITLGEIVNYYAFNIFWFILLIINLILIEYFTNDINNYINSNPCIKLDITNVSVCEDYFNFLTRKIFISKKNIFAFMIINFLHLLAKKYINKYLIYISSIFENYLHNDSNKQHSNNDNSSEVEIFIIIIFSLLTLLNNPVVFNIYKYYEIKELEKEIENYENLILLYFISEYFAFVVILFTVSCLIIDLYNSKIKNFKIKYVETKFIDIEKNG